MSLKRVEFFLRGGVPDLTRSVVAASYKTAHKNNNNMLQVHVLICPKVSK